MKLKDVEDEQGKEGRGRTPDRLDHLDSSQQQRRGSSSLLAAAGIGYENRRRLSQQTAEAQGRVFQQGNEVYVQDKDGKMTRLEVVEVKEKMGLLRKSVPTLPIIISILFCLLNTILPGTGTILGALSLLCCGKCRHEKVATGMKYGLIAAALQILTAVFIVGWIYSIYYGVNMIQDAMTKGGYEPEKVQEGAGSRENKSSSEVDVEASQPTTTSQ